jgi:nitrate/nitrite transport system ATP-binding protein
MVTHDVDEAILLSDRIALMTNGPAATIGEIIPVNLPRPRDRRTLTGMPEYHELKVRVLEFLYERYKAAS